MLNRYKITVSSMNKYETVKQWIVKSVPSFKIPSNINRCEYSKLGLQRLRREQRLGVVVSESRDEKSYRVIWDGNKHPTNIYKKFIEMVLEIRYYDRPIMLDDVLSAIGSGYGKYWLIHNDGREALEKIFELWHLGKSLEWHRDNAPEVIDFLYSLTPNHE